MFKYALYLLLIITVFSSIRVEEFTKQKLEHVKQFADYQHHFIFFHKPTLEGVKQKLDQVNKWIANDIKVYINDCRYNNLPECANPEQEPVLLLFNRILIRFNGDPKSIDQIIEWGETRIYSSPKYLNSRQELDSFLATSPNSFCFCQPPDRIEDSGMFYVLSKSLPHQSYCIINNIETFTAIGLKENNVTLFLNNATNRREFQHPHQFESWEIFVKVNMFPTLPRVQEIVGERFTHKEKNIEAVILVCDFSFNCDPVWEQLRQLQPILNKEQLGYNFYIALQDQKESYTFYLYYHFQFDFRRLPALVHIDLKGNGEDSGTLVRQFEYINQVNRATIDKFVTNTQKGLIKPHFASAPLPKNNGFYGKASEKFIQKIVAANAESVIAASQNHYIVLITALGIQCATCDTFYKDYKQIASLLIEKDLTFGVLNVNENEVPFKSVTQLPEILLFKKDDKQHPIRMNVNHSFDHLMLFFKNNLGNSYADPNEL